MKLSKDQLALVRQCSSADEVYVKAQEAGFELTEEEAETLYRKFEFRTLDVEDLSFVSGGCFSLDEALCEICQKFGKIHHAYTVGSPVGNRANVCDACYEQHKNDPDKYWSDVY